jgi:hypothetical protein
MKCFIHILEIIINPTIIGIIGATTGAIVGSITIAHIETTRQKNEENKKLLRNLYFKIYTELEHCYLTQNGFRNVNVYIGVTKSVSIVEINSHIEKLFENNIDILDANLFQLYHKIKSEQYRSDVTGGIAEYEYLKLYASILKDMTIVLRKTKMSNKYLLKIFKNLHFEYLVWHSLMERILDWKKVETILIGSHYFKRSFKKINSSIFVNKLFKNKKLTEDEFIKLFKEYCLKEIKFPVLNKYFWT